MSGSQFECRRRMQAMRLFAVAATMLFICSAGPGQETKRDQESKPDPSTTGYLGIMVTPSENGVVIREVTPDSPAAKAGLKSGDRVSKLSDQEVRDAESFIRSVGSHKPGDKLTIQVVRDGKDQAIEVTLGQRPARQERESAYAPNFQGARRPAFLGVQMQPLTPQMRDQMKVKAESGVVVTSVAPNSPAAKAGLQPNDVITALDNTNVKDPGQLRELIQQAGPGKEISVQIARGSETQTVKAKLEEANFGTFLTPGSDRFPTMDLESVGDPTGRLRKLERRVEELEKRVRDLEKQKGSQP